MENIMIIDWEFNDRRKNFGNIRKIFNQNTFKLFEEL